MSDLETAFREAGLQVLSLDVETLRGELLITPALLAHWFDLEAKGARPSYAQHLLAQLAPDEVERFRELWASTHLNQTVVWASRIAYLVARR